MVFSKNDISKVSFSVMPQDAGQMIDVSYGYGFGISGGPQWLVRKTEYREDGSISIDCRRLANDASVFEPQNGVLPNCTGEWLDVVKLDGYEFRIASVGANGEWDFVETFRASDEDSANEYAANSYAGDEWYVVDVTGRNINGGEEE